MDQTPISTEEALRRLNDPTEEMSQAEIAEAQVIVAWRYVGQPVKSGVRIDLQCCKCGHRVCLGPESQANLRPAVCRECAAASGKFGL